MVTVCLHGQPKFWRPFIDPRHLGQLIQGIKLLSKDFSSLRGRIKRPICRCKTKPPLYPRTPFNQTKVPGRTNPIFPQLQPSLTESDASLCRSVVLNLARISTDPAEYSPVFPTVGTLTAIRHGQSLPPLSKHSILS